jgi:hypothetical protein
MTMPPPWSSTNTRRSSVAVPCGVIEKTGTPAISISSTSAATAAARSDRPASTISSQPAMYARHACVSSGAGYDEPWSGPIDRIACASGEIEPGTGTSRAATCRADVRVSTAFA